MNLFTHARYLCLPAYLSGAGGTRTRDQRISAPPFAVDANKSRIYLSTNRLRGSLPTHGCRQFSLRFDHKRRMKAELGRSAGYL